MSQRDDVRWNSADQSRIGIRSDRGRKLEALHAEVALTEDTEVGRDRRGQRTEDQHPRGSCELLVRDGRLRLGIVRYYGARKTAGPEPGREVAPRAMGIIDDDRSVHAYSYTMKS